MTHFFVVAVLPESVDHNDKGQIELWLNESMYRYCEHNKEAFSTFYDYYVAETDPSYRLEESIFGEKVSELKFPRKWIQDGNKFFEYWFLPNGEYQARNIVGRFGNTYNLNNNPVEAEQLWQKRLAHIRKQYKDHYCIGLDCHV